MIASPPSIIEDFISKNKEEYISSEIFNIISNNNKIYNLKIAYNEIIINFEIEESNTFPKKEYNLSQSLSELVKIDKYFLLFEKTEEVFNSFKNLFSEKNLNIIEEDNQIKIKILNSITNKDFYIIIPPKAQDLKDEIKQIYNYINKLEEKIKILEKETKEIKIENNKLKEKNLEYDNIIKENALKIEKLEQKLNNYVSNNTKIEKIDNNDMSFLLKNSKIVKKDEINLILDWIGIKPKSFILLLDSKIDGDLTNTFYEKCKNKKPTIIFIKTTKGFRFGGYTNEFWASDGFKRDPNSFIFSLDKKRKYKVIEADSAIYLQKNYGFCFGNNAIFLYNKCTNHEENITDNLNTHYFPQNINELNNGKRNFKVSNYEVYQIII